MMNLDHNKRAPQIDHTLRIMSVDDDRHATIVKTDKEIIFKKRIMMFATLIFTTCVFIFLVLFFQ